MKPKVTWKIAKPAKTRTSDPKLGAEKFILLRHSKRANAGLGVTWQVCYIDNVQRAGTMADCERAKRELSCIHGVDNDYFVAPLQDIE